MLQNPGPGRDGVVQQHGGAIGCGHGQTMNALFGQVPLGGAVQLPLGQAMQRCGQRGGLRLR